MAEGQDIFTGAAILNASTETAQVTLEVYLPNGQLAGSTAFSLGPGRRVARLLHEFIPAAITQRGGYFRIKSDKPVISFALFGSTDGRFLSAIGPQKLK